MQHHAKVGVRSEAGWCEMSAHLRSGINSRVSGSLCPQGPFQKKKKKSALHDKRLSQQQYKHEFFNTDVTDLVNLHYGL